MQHKQQGLTAISWLVIILIAGVLVLSVIKLLPTYLDNYTVASSLNSLKELPDLQQKDDDEIYRLIQTRFDINNISTVKAEEAEISRAEGAIAIYLDYEVRTSLLGNIDAVMVFSESVEIVAR